MFVFWSDFIELRILQKNFFTEGMLILLEILHRKGFANTLQGIATIFIRGIFRR